MSLVNSLSQPNNPALELYDLLIQNPSLFGRLVQVANLRNPAAKSHALSLPPNVKVQSSEPDGGAPNEGARPPGAGGVGGAS